MSSGKMKAFKFTFPAVKNSVYTFYAESQKEAKELAAAWSKRRKLGVPKLKKAK